jgi:hypothetical protein
VGCVLAGEWRGTATRGSGWGGGWRVVGRACAGCAVLAAVCEETNRVATSRGGLGERREGD